MKSLNEFVFVVYNVNNNEIEKISPRSEEKLILRIADFGESERAVMTLYEKEFDYQVVNLNHKHQHPLKHAFGLCKHYELEFRTPQLSIDASETLKMDIHDNISSSEFNCPLNYLETYGMPDLFAYNQSNNKYVFIEVKQPDESLRGTQINWFKQFNFLPIKIAYVFQDEQKLNEYIPKLESRLSDI